MGDANRGVRDVLLREVRTLVLTAMVSLILICATVERRWTVTVPRHGTESVSQGSQISARSRLCEQLESQPPPLLSVP